MNFLITACKYLDQNRVEKCDEFFREFLNIWLVIFNSNLILPIILIFLSILFLIFKQPINKFTKKQNYIIIFLLTILFYLILFNFRTNIPWVDDWEWIENLQTGEFSNWSWLNQPTNIHNIFFTKIIFLFVNNYLNQNFEFFNYLSIFLIFLISLLVLSKEDKINSLGVSLIIILIFSGKQFANFTQSSNIVWSLCFFFTILIYKFIDQQNIKSLIINSTIIFIAPLTFGLGYVIPIYIIFFIYFHNIYKNFKILYIFLSIAGLLISVIMPRLFLGEIGYSFSARDYLDLGFIINYKFYVTFFGVLSNVYLPWIDGFAYIGFIIGSAQFFIIILILLKKYRLNSYEEFSGFLSKNILISIGLIFAFLVSLTRNDLQTVVAARYSVGSILFQIGFWKLVFENYKFVKIVNRFILSLIILYVLFLGIFSPYHGIHWQANRYVENAKILNCYKSNDEKICNKLAYKLLFYGGDWYDFDTFEKQIRILKRDKKSFFNF